ncbi:hypothetical protein [Arthrobacter oryzae]|uniref:hypothetical protein n=1 Tax=Arthrobacter oryzae TaxID=409290 RepID=UPI00277F68C8|nr:hypothetical protein [Arthrobacter oryzae]MDQ0079605.1 hypothetical protein [Arthrobacter oryzae]
MKKWLVPTAVLASIFAAAAPAAAAPSGPPISLEGVEIERQCGDLDAGGFIVKGVLSGGFKDITLPNGTLLSPSPALKVTLTANGKTVKYVITGVTRVTTVGDLTHVVATGRNLITRPDEDPGDPVVGGLYVTSGNVSFTNDQDGELIPFSGPGRVVDVCEVLAP